MQTFESQPDVDLSTAPQFVDTITAAKILGVSATTLIKWRHYRTPNTPPYATFGRRSIRYSLTGLRAWAAQRTRAA